MLHNRRMSLWSLRFLGVGNAAATALGSASVVLERDGAPLLMVDCGPEALTAWQDRYGGVPPAVFVTHVHLDHVAGFERLFVANYFGTLPAGPTRLYVPATLVPLLQERVAGYPNVVAEGSANFWDAFQLVPVAHGFWYAGLWFDVFAVRHHVPGTAYGIALRGSFLYTGDTRPIPETVAAYADGQTRLVHDCDLTGNPSHTGLPDLLREYPADLRRQMTVYHYASPADGDALAAAGLDVARPGDVRGLSPPIPPEAAHTACMHARLGIFRPA
jgi:glyoxylase-like metal-dependent hydrolase (beta-lactamase superfamily II)